jgi:hypothetical protein
MSKEVRQSKEKSVKHVGKSVKGAALQKKPVSTELTRVIIKYDVGFNNSLYIRGKGGGLSWDHGIPLRNISPNEWIWESTLPCDDCEFKVLINDKHYETGENHRIYNGGIVQYTPCFS